MANKQIRDTASTFLLNIPKGQEQTFYIKVHTLGTYLGEIIIHKNQNSYLKDKLTFTSLYVFYFGAVFIVILLNIFVSIVTKEKIYIYYAGAVGSLGFYFAVLSGISNYFITTLYYELYVIGIIGLLFFIFFSKEFLEVKKHNKYMNTSLNIIIGALLIIILFFNTDAVYWFRIYLKVSSIALLLLLLTAISSIKYGGQTAKIYLAIIISYILTIGLFSLVTQGVIENNNFNRYSFLLVSFIEMSFFTLMLANRFNQTKNELLKNTLQNEELLEKQVLTRTKELEDARDELQKLSEQDALTTLYNRRYFEKIAKYNFTLAQREKQVFSIMMLDLDYFKNVNDTYGHSVGDDVLVGVSKALLSVARQSDVCIRYGGEEFLIFLPNIDLPEAQIAAQRVRNKIKKLCFSSDKQEPFSITVSIGISQFLPEDKDICNIVKRADEALYTSKGSGRDRVSVI
ncbi:MAG: diguanylate cyclase [Sulfurimonas sp.]|nr:diguanylate cyclase [Sulfurimonas sp.]